MKGVFQQHLVPCQRFDVGLAAVTTPEANRSVFCPESSSQTGMRRRRVTTNFLKMGGPAPLQALAACVTLPANSCWSCHASRRSQRLRLQAAPAK